MNASLPCDGPVLVSLTTELAATNGSSFLTIMVATCIAPAVTGGCTVSVAPLAPPVPDGITLWSPTGPDGPETHTATAVFPAVTRGNYKFDVFINNSATGIPAQAGRRTWTVHAGGTLPSTAPGSSQ